MALPRRRVLLPAATALTLALALALSAWQATAAPPPARTVQGMVSTVTDGDSLWLKPADGPPIEVRLRDIDAPEICQPWGEDARKALAELALNKVATLQISGRDSYGRTIGALLIEDLNVGKHLVENGHAWSVRTRWDQGPLVKQEKMARALARGLHGTPGAVQPKDFRQKHGRCEPAPAAAPAATTPPAPKR
jgi:micrococcal nuclease